MPDDQPTGPGSPESRRPNCWEEKRCGCEPGGARVAERGVCPAAVDASFDGINGGTNAGRICWAVAGTLCDETVQGSFEEKIGRCERCSFFRHVKYQEGGHLQLLKLGAGNTGVAELHRLLNSAAKLVGICRDILACLAEEPLLARIVGHALGITDSCSAAAYLIDGAEGHLVLAAHAGPLTRAARVRTDNDSLVARAARERVFCKGDLKLPGKDAPASVAAVPMGGHEKLPGVLELVKTAGAFSTDDEWFLREFGLIAGLGIENARHVDDLYQLRQFDKAKSRFVALLMHHVASPLATIACSLQALKQLGSKLTDADRDELIHNSLDQINAVQGLSRRLLDLAAIRGGRSLCQVRPVRVAELLGQEVEAHQAQATEKGLEIVVVKEGTGALVSADPDGLRLIFGNLIGNAVKYSTSESKTVRVELVTAPEAVRLTVRDKGVGIPRQEQATVFEEFRRGSNVAAAKASGFGLGLPMVKELVQRYHGRIELSSEPGAGTTVSVEFPAAQE